MGFAPEIPLHIDPLIDKLLQATISAEEFDILSDWRALDSEHESYVKTLVLLCETCEPDEGCKRIVRKAFIKYLESKRQFNFRILNSNS